MVQLLIAAGAEVTARDEEHNATPLGWAETSIHVSNNPACAEVATYLKSVNGGASN